MALIRRAVSRAELSIAAVERKRTPLRRWRPTFLLQHFLFRQGVLGLSPRLISPLCPRRASTEHSLVVKKRDPLLTRAGLFVVCSAGSNQKSPAPEAMKESIRECSVSAPSTAS